MKKSRPNTSSTVPAYFSQYINNYFDEDQAAGDIENGHLRQNSPYATARLNLQSGDGKVVAKKFIPLDEEQDKELELEDWAHNLNDDDFVVL